jgi:hypothetical protein
MPEQRRLRALCFLLEALIVVALVVFVFCKVSGHM